MGLSDGERAQVCADCGNAVTDRYCAACGQNAAVNRSLRTVRHELAHGVFHVESKGWKTLVQLALRPGVLTRRYIAGQRTRYLSPVTMFFTSAFLMFFAFGFIGITANRDRQTAIRQIAECQAIGGAIAGSASQPAPVDPTLVVRRYQPTLRWLVRNAPLPLQRGVCTALQSPKSFVTRVQQKAYKLGFLLVPLSLPVLWLMFLFRPDTRMYDHAVFALYSISFMSLLAVIASALWAIGITASAPYVVLIGVFPLVHMYRHLKQSYLLSDWQTAWRTVVLAAAAVASLALFVSVMLVFGLLG